MVTPPHTPPTSTDSDEIVAKIETRAAALNGSLRGGRKSIRRAQKVVAGPDTIFVTSEERQGVGEVVKESAELMLHMRGMALDSKTKDLLKGFLMMTALFAEMVGVELSSELAEFKDEFFGSGMAEEAAGGPTG